ncbi:DUF5926 family protein [Quadrisphaera sp. DSM 44207]|uniref:DUF5926 family protein n=1 Tax=Quadrisphaera sp. DSM 44207 TaxID=1881057 RepID=UPI000890C19A|nr:DUF5926 family protein [Quadrisphaera sp. DSM 44207]SDQ22143.1 SEC-C motif-containing protein [Quadrisphaera sp. DSM 44207]
MSSSATQTVPAVGPRQPCPCGSGKRYKACHGRAAAARASAFVPRPFAGLPGEGDWVALREVVPAATALVRTAAGAAEHGAEPGAQVVVASVLPAAAAALRRADGSVLLGLQTPVSSGDPSRDAAAALVRAMAAEPGTALPPAGLPGPGPRLQDLLDPDGGFAVTVHDGFGFWVADGARTPETDAALQEANASVVPTRRLTGVEAAYWCQVGHRRHLRWVLPHEEDALLDALARLHAAGASALGPESRYLGAFRAHGLLVPVWDLAPDAGAQDVEEPAAAFAARLEEALAATGPLSAEERRARAGVVSRQLTLR